MRKRPPKITGFTLIEGLVVILILGLLYVMFIPQGVSLVKQARFGTARQQAQAIQDALERWQGEQPSITAARTIFNSNMSATTPTSQVAFFNSALAPLLDSTMGADVAANSTASSLGSTQMNLCGASATITWDTNYTVNHPKVNLVLPP